MIWSRHWHFEKRTLWTLHRTCCYLEGGGVGLFIWFGWQALVYLDWQQKSAGSCTVSSASEGAGRPILGRCPFVLIRKKTHSEWSVNDLKMIVTVQGILALKLGCLENPMSKSDEGVPESAAVLHSWTSRLLTSFTALERRHQGSMDWKAIHVKNQLNSQLAAASCLKLNT